MPCYALWSSYVEWRITMTISSVPSGDQNSENGKGGWRLTRVDRSVTVTPLRSTATGRRWRLRVANGIAYRGRPPRPGVDPGGADRAGMS